MLLSDVMELRRLSTADSFRAASDFADFKTEDFGAPDLGASERAVADRVLDVDLRVADIFVGCESSTCILSFYPRYQII